MATANVDKQTAEPCNSERNEDLIDDNERMGEAVVEESKDIPLEPLNTPWTFWIDRYFVNLIDFFYEIIMATFFSFQKGQEALFDLLI